MSKNIDEHVLDMRFENKQFEKGVGKSLTTIEKLKKSLDFRGMSKGLSNVSDSAAKIDFAGAVKGVKTLASRISIMGVIATSIIQGITRKVISLGQGMARVLIFEPVFSGFSEYETQINAIQTILANTAKEGTNLEQVSTALGLLNTYADQTIYNFTEMTRNIGTFTAAGVALQTSVDAIKGIANLAAVSGSTSQQASTAMYQLSQALSTGSLKLQDWNSVVNAGMGGQIFTLSSGWLSSEILTDTLKKFTGDLDEATLMQQGYTQTQAKEIVKLGVMANDAATKVKTLTQLGDTLKEAAQSGWTQSWELIIGDFDQAKAFLTKVSETLGELIGASADARNELLAGWEERGGRGYAIGKLFEAFNNLLAIMAPIKEAFRETFPAVTVQTLIDLTLAFGRFVDNFKIGAVGAAKIKTIFGGLFSILDIGRLAILAIIKAIFPLGENLSGLGETITDIVVSVAEYISTLRETIKVNDTFTKAITKILTTIEPFYKGLLAFIDAIKTKLGEFKGLDFGPIKEFFSKFKSIDITPIKETINELWEMFTNLSLITKITDFDLEPIKKFFQGIIDTVAGFDPSIVLQAIATAFGGGLVIAISKWLDLLGKTVTSLATGGVVLALTGYLNNIAKIAGNVADAVENVSEILEGVGGVLQGWQNNLNAKALKSIAIAIAILAVSLFLISTIDPDKLTVGLAGLTALLVELFLIMKGFSGSASVNLTALSLGLIGISVALLILSIAVKNISSLSEGELLNSVGAITAFLTGLVVAMRVMSTASKDVARGSAAMGLISIALSLLTISVRALGTMDVDALKQGILAVGALLLGLAAFTRVVGGPDNIISIGVSIGILAGSLLIMAKSVEAFGSMDIEVLKQGLQGMGAALLMVAIATQSLPKDMLVKAVGLAIVAGSLIVLAEALKIMGELDGDKLESALIALGTSLLILVTALHLMSGSLAGSAALLVAAGALFILANALMLLGSMSINEIGLALLALVGFLVIFGLAGLILGPMVPILIALGGALVLFGVAALLVGLGVSVLAAGLAVLAVSGGAAIGVLILALSGIISLIPYLVEQLGVALLVIIRVITEAAPKLVAAIISILESLIKGFVTIIPQLVEAVLDLLLTLLTTIAEKLPDLIQAGFDILLALLQGIADNIGDVVTTVGDIIIAFLDAMALKLPEIVQAGFEFLIAFLDGLTLAIEDNLPVLIQSFYDMGIALLMGLIDGLGSAIGQALAAVKEIAAKILRAFLDAWNIESPSGETFDMAKNLMFGVRDGIIKYGIVATKAASEMGNDLIGALSDATSTIGDILDSNLALSPVITPVLDLTDFSWMV